MAGRRRKKRSSVGAFKLPKNYLVTGATIGVGIVAGKVLGQVVGDIVSKNLPMNDKDGKPLVDQGQVKGFVSGLIQVIGGVAVNYFVKGETGQRLSEGMVGSGAVTAASNILKELPGFSVNGVPYGSTYLPGVAGPSGSPYGSTYLPGVAGVIIE